jgi:endo-1,4-beta-D-glucanase Y
VIYIGRLGVINIGNMEKTFFALAIYGIMLSSNLYSLVRQFPANHRYEYGYMSGNITSQDAISEYNSWMSSYYVECGGDESRINDNGLTVSEGIGYGMVLTAYAGDSVKFDRLWNYYKNRMNGNGVMHWQYSGCNTGEMASNGATDGELDAAMGLLVAFHQWPGRGYGQPLENLLNSIKTHEFEDCNGLIVQKPGDAWGGCGCTNPSYFAPGYYRAFAQYYEEKGDNGNAEWWRKAADDSYIVLFRNQHHSSGLVTAWTNSSGDAGPCGGVAGGGGAASTYQYDACRTPWRIATDYLWWGADDAKTFLSPVVNFVNSSIGDLQNVVDRYEHDGTATGQWNNTPFVGSFALAGMAVSQYDTDRYMLYFQKIMGDNYFNSSLSVMYKFLATGNYWNPYSSGSGSSQQCPIVRLGADKTLCGSGEAVLNAGLPQGDGMTFTWYRGSSLLQSSASNTYAAAQEGIYRVVMDSAGVCSTEATVTVSASLPQPLMPRNVVLDQPVVLDAIAEGAGIYYKWLRNGAEIQGESFKTLEITKEGRYNLEVSAAGCQTLYAETAAEMPPFINRAAQLIAIDGTPKDLPYKRRSISKLLAGAAGGENLSAEWAGAWNDTYIYIFAYVTDSDLRNDSGSSWWDDDGIEVFIDSDNSKLSAYGEKDFQWSFRWNSASADAGNSNAHGSTDGVLFAWADIPGGYYIETAIPWATLKTVPEIGSTLGFDIAVNDDDGGGPRNNKIAWNAAADDGWRNPSLFGNIKLAGILEENITVQYNIEQGWNLISVNLLPDVAGIKQAFPGAAIVKNADGFYSSSQPTYLNSLASIEAGKAYLVYAGAGHTAILTGKPAAGIDPAEGLQAGWNMMGTAWQGDKSLKESLGAQLDKVDAIKDFDRFWMPGSQNGLNSFTGGKAYFVRIR